MSVRIVLFYFLHRYIGYTQMQVALIQKVYQHAFSDCFIMLLKHMEEDLFNKVYFNRFILGKFKMT